VRTPRLSAEIRRGTPSFLSLDSCKLEYCMRGCTTQQHALSKSESCGGTNGVVRLHDRRSVLEAFSTLPRTPLVLQCNFGVVRLHDLVTDIAYGVWLEAFLLQGQADECGWEAGLCQDCAHRAIRAAPQ